MTNGKSEPAEAAEEGGKNSMKLAVLLAISIFLLQWNVQTAAFNMMHFTASHSGSVHVSMQSFDKTDRSSPGNFPALRACAVDCQALSLNETLPERQHMQLHKTINLSYALLKTRACESVAILMRT